MKNFLAKMYINAREQNDRYLIGSIKRFGPFKTLLDIGCWDGELTMKYALAASAKEVLGMEVVKEMAEKAEQKGIKCVSLRADQDTWPFEDNSLDCIVSNQVIEHLSYLDHFFSESTRTLKKGGVIITSTNNLSSWHNIFALLFGWAPFDLSNSSSIAAGIGNPLSVHRGEKSGPPSWTHKCIYTPRWLFEWQQLYGLQKLSHMGAGFYPLTASMGNVFKNHAAFMIIATKK
jgi:SAM-dependent methyltransferase